MEKVSFDNPEFPKQLLADLSVNPDDLDNEFIKQASLFSFYAEQARLAANFLEKKKLRLQVEEAKLSKSFRDEYTQRGIKPTEKMIESSVFTNPTYIAVYQAVSDARSMRDFIRDNLEAFKHKRDCLVQMSISKREDMKGSMHSYTEDKIRRYSAGIKSTLANASFEDEAELCEEN